MGVLLLYSAPCIPLRKRIGQGEGGFSEMCYVVSGLSISVMTSSFQFRKWTLMQPRKVAH